ncbi:hypothetical protein CEXT_496381, partial [Caerostris extrusa]
HRNRFLFQLQGSGGWWTKVMESILVVLHRESRERLFELSEEGRFSVIKSDNYKRLHSQMRLDLNEC